jgi:regulator of replication initiation timing
LHYLTIRNAVHITGTMSYNLPGLIAAVFPSVSDAPIRLQGKAIDHVFESPGEIMSSIKNFYVNETLKQVYKIIGSLDFVGNPTILFSSFVTGVRDLVVAPTSAFLKSPTNVNQVGIGVAKGAISLFSHSASGIFGFSAKMSATAGQAVAILSLDAEFRQWHRDRVVTEAANLNRVWKRRGVQSVSEMVTRPVGDILLGVAMGATGFFTSPYKGLRKGGGLGLLQGVAVGTAGVIAKPLVGFLDAFTHFSATAHDIAKSVNVLERRYQPALKLRLPYIFGPMNVLAAFDPDAARSVYLLKIFPPKAKRTNLKRGDSARWKEIHVASVVLYMEPGVETYAIATTIRVVLIKLKKESGGSLAPTFCWEVDLTGRAVVSSRVSDHGHNGVALTITKCAQDGKAEVAFASPDAKGKQNSPETTQGDNDNVQTANISSARSVDSGYVPEEEVISEVAGETTKSEYFDSENPRTTVVETLPGGELENSYHEHGATEKGGEVLEWFTVLAEYQHRRQLTHLHNAISCIVGDFNAVIVDRGRAHEQNTEGSTLFGMFGFEDGITDGKAAHTANYELVAALESLPWMHEDVFKICKGRPRSQQRETVAKLRQNWVFSRDLEASMAQAGPAWLIETRARAMFVSGAAPPVPQFLDPEDPVVKEVLSQLEQGNISSEQANRLMLSRNELCSDETSHHEGIVSVSSKDVDRLVETTRRANSSDHAQYGEIPGQRASSGGQRSHTSSLGASIGSRSGMDERRPLSRGVSEDKTAQVQKDRLSSRLEISNEIFHSTRMESIRPPLFVEQEPEYTGTLSEERRSTGTVEARDSAIDGPIGSATSGQQTTIGDSDLPHFKYPVAAEKRKLFHEGSTPVDGSEALESTAARQHQATKINNASFDTPVSGPLNPSPDSRMDKMESILEQLVILNATQAQIKTIPTDITSDVHSVTSESKAANAIRSELDDLRAQAQARMKEDEALKNEIATLRQQLAERRNNSTPVKASTKERARTPTKEWNRKVMKVPEIFRNVAKHGSRKQDDDTKETSDVPKETSNGAGAIPNGRYVASGTSSKESENEGVISLKSGSPEQGRAYRKSNEGEMPRRSSGDSMEYELNQMQRRNSTAGTERQERIMQRRLSGDASN